MLRSLRARLVLSHVLVAVVATGLTFLAVRLVAPSVLARQGHGAGGGSGAGAGSGGGRGGHGQGAGARQQLLDTVTSSLEIGAVLGLVVAVGLGFWLAWRISRPVEASAAAARALSEGEWSVRVPQPREQELAELAGAVNALGERLGRTEEARVELLRDVSHEMRTPISVVRASVEGMLDGVLGRDDAELNGIHTEVLRLQRLTEDLSALSRFGEASAQSLQLQDGDLCETALEVAGTFRGKAAAAGIELVLVPAERPCPVRLDPDRVGQVVANLLSNAIKATDAGGTVTVSVGEAQGAAAGGAGGMRAGEGWLSVRVQDTGCGLALAELEHVFERFWRGRADRAGTGAGTGIGLTISRDIARAHGGTLRLSSEGRGKGTTAELLLPRL